MEFRVPPAPRNACPSGLDTIIRFIHTADFANLEVGLRCIVLVYNDMRKASCVRVGIQRVCSTSYRNVYKEAHIDGNTAQQVL
jgi:hypothetical protein